MKVTTAGPDAALELAVGVFPRGFCIPPKARHVREFRLPLFTDAGRDLSGCGFEISVQPHGDGSLADCCQAFIDRAAVKPEQPGGIGDRPVGYRDRDAARARAERCEQP